MVIHDFAALEARLEHDHVSFRVQPGQPTLWMASAICGGQTELCVHWAACSGLVHVTQLLPFVVHELRRGEVALAIAAINHDLALGAFLLDVTAGHLGFRASAMLSEDGSVALSHLQDLVATCIDTASRYVDDLHRLCSPPPDEAPPWWSDDARRAQIEAELPGVWDPPVALGG